MRLIVPHGLYENCLDYYKMAGKTHIHVTREKALLEKGTFSHSRSVHKVFM